MTTTAPALAKPVTFKGVLGVKPLLSYVDPHPGLHGSDRITVRVECDRCGGTGIFTWWNQMGKCQGSCFKCWGVGKNAYERAVSSLRREAKADAYARDYADELAALWAETEAANAAAAEAAAAERAAEEFAAAWDAAHAEAARRAALVTGFVGEVGDTLKNLSGVVSFTKVIDGQYGSSVLMSITLADGKVVKFFGTGSSVWGWDKGDAVTIVSATVKGRENYQGQDATVLTRVKLDDLEARISRHLSYVVHYGMTDAELLDRGFKKAELARVREVEAERLAASPELAAEVAAYLARA